MSLLLLFPAGEAEDTPAWTYGLDDTAVFTYTLDDED